MRDFFEKLRPLDALFPLLAFILVWPLFARYERPVQDRDFGSLGGGSADFASYYLGSLAYVRGFDPYLNGRPEFRDPWRREIQIDDVPVGQYYLPGHYLGFAPLAWIYGEDWEAASRTYLRLHAGLLVLLAWLVCVGARGRRARHELWDRGRQWQLLGLGVILIGLQLGTRVGLERGQSDVVQSVLIWGGVVLASQGQMAAAAFLIVAGASFKGYGAILLVGLGLAQLGKTGFRALVLGGLAASLPIVFLTWPFLTTALRVALHQSEDFSFHWMNHSFKHVGFAVGQGVADPIRYLLSLAALGVAFLCWNRYRLAEGGKRPDSNWWLVVAATVSIATMIGFSATSAPYNLVLLLPGLIWIADLLRSSHRMSWSSEVLFATAFFLIFLGRTPLRQFAPAAYGMVLFVIWCGLTARGRARDSVPGAEASESVTLPLPKV